MHAKKIIFLSLLFILLVYANAAAHRLNIFAWLDNNSIVVRCNFNKNHPAKSAMVKVLDDFTHQQLLEGQTDENGEFTFHIPAIVRQGHGLLIKVNAGQGHNGEWKMEASELYSAASLTAGFEAAKLQKSSDNNPANISATAHQEQTIEFPERTSLDKAELTEIINHSLAPIHRQLAELANKGPGLSEILGGIGWIMGLCGIIFYFMARKK